MPQIIPIKNLKNTSRISGMCHKPDESVYIIKNGYGSMVILNMEIYESAMHQFTIYRDAGLSEEHIKNGRIKKAMIDLAGMRNKYVI
ncbi:MAG: type II toxin-antitoxin system Phd/YefM family antitoxin [Lachnospiraceae bacterium]|nr:type II toxin-antitoxin system Phd/YefM family antitoxin [Lachnospiraceae bacterium]